MILQGICLLMAAISPWIAAPVVADCFKKRLDMGIGMVENITSMYECKHKCINLIEENNLDCLYFTYLSESQYCVFEFLHNQIEKNPRKTIGAKECFLQEEKAYDGMDCYNETSISDYWPLWKYQMDADNKFGCWKECEEMKSCIFFAYDEAQTDKKCSLTTRNFQIYPTLNGTKSEIPFMKQEDFKKPQKVQSASKHCVQGREKCYGYGTSFQILPFTDSTHNDEVANAEDCWKECYHRERCKYFTFFKSNNTCEIFDISSTVYIRPSHYADDVNDNITLVVSGNVDCILDKQVLGTSQKSGGKPSIKELNECFLDDMKFEISMIPEPHNYVDSVQDIDECWQTCSKTVGCKFFSYFEAEYEAEYEHVTGVDKYCELYGIYETVVTHTYGEGALVSGSKECIEGTK